MVDLGCQDTDWVGGNDKECLLAIFLHDDFILATSKWRKEKVVILGDFLVGLGP